VIIGYRDPVSAPFQRAFRPALGAVIVAALLMLWAAPGASAANLQATPLPFAGGASDLIVGPDGALWLAGKERDEVDRFDPGSGALQPFPVPHAEDEGEGEGPTSLAAGADGQVWYLTDGGRQIGRISSAGVVTPVWKSKSFDSVNHISAAQGGGVWASVGFTSEDQEVFLLSESGTETKYPYEGEYSEGGPIATAPDGSAWVGDWGARISGISLAGAVTSYETAIGSTEEINSIAFAPDGTVWYAGFSPEILVGGEAGVAYSSAYGGSIGRLVPGSGQQGFTVGQNTLTGSITSGGDGSMWFATRGGVGRIEPSGAYKLGSTAPYQPGLSYAPADLVYGPQGALWFVDNEKSALVRVAVDAQLFPPPALPPPAPTPAPIPKAPKARINAKHLHVKVLEKRHGIPLTCVMRGAGECAVGVTIHAKDAKKLHLKVPKKAKLLTLGHGSSTFKKAGSQPLLVKLTPKVLRALSHLRGKLDLMVKITTSAPGATDTNGIEELALRR
jgi:virginiamycin B lyase